MKKLLILSVCFVVTLGNPKDTAAVSAMALSFIPPSSPFLLYIPGIKTSKYVQEFVGDRWRADIEAEKAETRVVRSSKPRNIPINDTIRQNQNDEELKIVTTTMTYNVVTEDYASKLRLAYLECVDETLVEVKLVMQFKAGNWAEHPSVLEWALCVLNKVHLMSLQGVFQYDTVMARTRYDDREAVDKILDRCLEPKPLPPKRIAWKYLKCINYWDWKKEYPYLSIFYNI